LALPATRPTLLPALFAVSSTVSSAARGFAAALLRGDLLDPDLLERDLLDALFGLRDELGLLAFPFELDLPAWDLLAAPARFGLLGELALPLALALPLLDLLDALAFGLLAGLVFGFAFFELVLVSAIVSPPDELGFPAPTR
jgi:hypothetical protein